MKPVEKGPATKTYAAYGNAKPDLLSKMGGHCSYCECGAAAQNLDVEHIYPKDPHPRRELDWDNLLVACKTCNTYKHHHLGSRRQRSLLKRYIWPHLDNTFKAYKYQATGQVDIDPGVPAALIPAVEATREMVGLLLSPTKAKSYQDLGIAYDGANKRSQMWGMANRVRAEYLKNPSPDGATTVAECAAMLGYFSIWMEVFSAELAVRKELIRLFKADPNCFDANTQPVAKGRM